MAKRSRASRTDRSSHPPLWLVEGLDIVDRRRGMLLAVVAGVIVVAAVLAVVLPGVVPPTAAVGAAIGLAALLLGVAAAVAADATDLIVRGPRHVAAAGGELVAVLPREPDVVSAGPLAEAIVEVREPGTPLLLGLAAAGRDARRSGMWTDAIARALVGSGVSVLRADLASGRSDGPGLLEVVREDERLARVVELEPGVRLARLAAGRDHAAALAALTELPGKLPQDLDILLVALPSATSRGVVAAAGALDHVLVVAERDRTSRVDLIAGLDALEAAGTQAQVVLLDTVTAMRLAPPVEVAEDESGTRRRGLASTVGRSPVVTAGAAAGGGAGGADGGADAVAADAEPDAALAPDADDAASAPDEADAADPDADLPADVGGDEPPVMGAVAGGSVAAAVTAALGAVPPTVDEDDHVEVDDQGLDHDVDDDADDDADDDEHLAAGDEVADDGLADQRDVEVLDAAAEATAVAMADAEAEPLPERLEDLPDAPATDGDPTATDAEAPAEDPAAAAAEAPAEDPVAPDDQTADLDPGGHDDRYGTFDADARGEESPFADPVVDLAPEEEEEAAPTDQPDPWQPGGERDDSFEADTDEGGEDLTVVDHDADDDVADADATDRIPPVGSDVTGAEADPAGGFDPSGADDPPGADDRSGADDRFQPGDTNESDEDLLRTTAQLAILADDLALRSGFQPEPESHSDTPAHPDRPHHLDGDDARESGGPDEDHT